MWRTVTALWLWIQLVVLIAVIGVSLGLGSLITRGILVLLDLRLAHGTDKAKEKLADSLMSVSKRTLPPTA
jgi:hypothetical protein